MPCIGGYVSAVGQPECTKCPFEITFDYTWFSDKQSTRCCYGTFDAMFDPTVSVGDPITCYCGGSTIGSGVMTMCANPSGDQYTYYN